MDRESELQVKYYVSAILPTHFYSIKNKKKLNLITTSLQNRKATKKQTSLEGGLLLNLSHSLV